MVSTEFPFNWKTDCERNIRFNIVISFKPGGRRIFFNLFCGIAKVQATETKTQLNLHELETNIAWIYAFRARCRAEKKADVPAARTTPADLQVTDHFLLRCGVQSLMKVKTPVAPTKKEPLAFNEIETVLESYLQPRKRLVIADRTKDVAITQTNGESSKFSGTSEGSSTIL